MMRKHLGWAFTEQFNIIYCTGTQYNCPLPPVNYLILNPFIMKRQINVSWSSVTSLKLNLFIEIM